MFLKPLKHSLTQISGQLPLRVIFVVPFVLQIFGTVGLVGYLSFRNGQQVVLDLSSQLRRELAARIAQQLYSYTEPAHIIAQMNAKTFKRGEINPISGTNQTIFWHWQNAILFMGNSGLYCGSEKDGSAIAVSNRDEGKVLLSLSNRNTDYRLVDYTLDDRGKPSKLVYQSTEIYDSRQRPWYQEAVKAGQPVWTKLQLDFDLPRSTMVAVVPIYDETRQSLLGVCGVDIFFPEEMTEFLQNLEVSPSGQTFIIERSGNIVASSLSEPPFLQDGETFKRLHASESQNFLVRETTRYLQDHFGSFDRIQDAQQLEFTLNGQREFVQIQPFQDQYGLEWLIVVVVPEADFMGQIHENTRTTIILCLVALIVATGLGILTARWVTRPILRLNQSAKALAKGQWQHTANIHRKDELGELAKSFNSMAVQLQDAFSTLENRVEERTAELAESNRQLTTAKEKADVANQAKSTFIANMSHELRTPLNAILGFSQILTRSQLLSPEQQENVSIINRSGEYLLTLINNVLNLSKIEAGKTTLNAIDFDLYSLLDEVEQMLYIKAEEKGLQLHVDYAEDVPNFIHSDRTKLHQVLINLINNGIKFTQEGGVSVRVTSHQSYNQQITHPPTPDPPPNPILEKRSILWLPPYEGGREGDSRGGEQEGEKQITNNQKPITIHFEIEDTGVGIAPEEIHQVFEAFGQTQSGATAKEGTGLGLPISRKFVQLMGGDITLQSELNHGTTFQFDIQVTLAESQTIPTHSERRAIAITSPQPSNYRLLIVDDKPVNRQLLLKLLAPFGLSLKEACHGQEAIEMWEEWQAHLIWMDLRMPVMDGYKATRIIRSKAENTTKIVAITASVLEEEKAVVLASGFDDFLRKPFRESDIFQALEKHLQIEFAYEESSLAPEELQLAQILPDDLDNLPEIWLKQFHQAIIEGRVDDMEDLGKEILSKNKKLATTLLDFVYQYEFEQLLELIEKASCFN